MSRARPLSPATEAALETWAAQRRRLYLEQTTIPCVLGRIRREQWAAGEGEWRLRQHWPEVYTGDGLSVQVVIAALRELPRLAVTYHYLLRWPWRVSAQAQAADMGIAVREYWRQLEIGETAVDVGLQVMASVQEWQALRRAA